MSVQVRFAVAAVVATRYSYLARGTSIEKNACTGQGVATFVNISLITD